MNRIILLSLTAATTAGLLFVNVYNSIVDAANWNAALPESIAVAREYFKVASPGSFFRIASPIGQLLALFTVVACWNYGRLRYIALATLLLAVGADALTFGYFYPRIDIMFNAPLANTEIIRSAVEQWTSMNWLRSAVCATSTFLAFTTLILTVKNTTV